MKVDELAQDGASIDERIGSVAVNADRSFCTDGLAYGAHSLDIFCVIRLTDLDFKCAKALLLEQASARADHFRP